MVLERCPLEEQQSLRGFCVIRKPYFIVWYLAIVQRWVITEIDRSERSAVGLADMSSEVRLLVLWADAFRLEPHHVHS